MSTDATKKPPTTVTNEPQELELVHQIRLSAYELYEKRGREVKTPLSKPAGGRNISSKTRLVNCGSTRAAGGRKRAFRQFG
jgi:hypothetical protein